MQHHLLQSSTRTMNEMQISTMSEEKCFSVFVEMRTALDGGQLYCPRCKRLPLRKNGVYIEKRRRLFSCVDCHHNFSPTSGTILHGSRLSYQELLWAVYRFALSNQAAPALDDIQKSGINYRTLFYLNHRFRAAMGASMAHITLKGKVEIDGVYVGKHVREANLTANRRDRRFRENQTGKKQNVVMLRQRGGPVLAFAFNFEQMAVPTILERIASGSVLYVDEAPHWKALGRYFKLVIIAHKEGHSIDGACTNGAENANRCLRAAEDQYRHISGTHVQQYAWEIAWRMNHNRQTASERFFTLLAHCLITPIEHRFDGIHRDPPVWDMPSYH